MRLRLGDILRVLAIFAGSLAVSFVLPRFGGPSSTTSIFNTMLIFSFLIGFFVNRALERRKAVWTSIEVELSRLRRLYNLGLQVSDESWCRLDRFSADEIGAFQNLYRHNLPRE